MMPRLFISLGVVISICISCDEGGGMSGGEPVIELLAPTTLTISNLGQNSFRVEWSSVTGADFYEVTIASDDLFDNTVSPYNELRENSTGLNVSNLEMSTEYFIRVRTVIDDQRSDYSITQTVTTLSEPDGEPDIALKEVATTFKVGMAVRASRLNGLHAQILEKEYNSLTSEFEMKMNIMYPRQGDYDFSKADAIVNYAEEHGMQVHGHALIWHAATPSWVENFAGTDQEFEDMVKDYITTTVSRYRGRVVSWDVVNEAFADGSGNLRNSVFLQRMGPDYIKKCHEWTRAADPDVLIFYNDYNMVTDDTKRKAALSLMDEFIRDGVPVDGFGFQMHIAYNGPSRSRIQSAANEVIDRELLLHFSELDVRANPGNDLSSLTDTRAEAQKKKVKEVVEVYNGIPDQYKFALTVWGLRDDESWLLDFWGQADWPLLYDKNFALKKAHTGFVEALQ